MGLWQESDFMKFYFVYVLQSLRDKLFYIGLTNNINRRLSEHQNGRNISTRNRRPLKLIFYEAYLNKGDAERRERYFKSTKGKTTLKQLIREYLKED